MTDKIINIQTTLGIVCRHDVDFWSNQYCKYLKGELQSLDELSNYLGINKGLLRNIIKECGFKPLSKEELNSRIKNKRVKTCLEKYGVSNTSKSKIFKEKIRQSHLNRSVEDVLKSNDLRKKTNTKKYGCVSYTQTSEYLNKVTNTCIFKYKKTHHLKEESIKDKRVKTCLERYGVRNVLQIPENKQKLKNSYNDKTLNNWKKFLSENNYELLDDFKGTYDTENNHWIIYNFKCLNCGDIFSGYFSNSQGKRMIRCNNCNPKRFGDCQNNISDFIENYGFEISLNNRKVIPPYEIDIFIPELNIGFEYNGDVWHSGKFNKQQNYHKNKTELALSEGIKLYHIWEHDDDEVKIESKISQILNKTKNKYSARKLKIKEVDVKQQKKFYEINHLHSYCVSTFTLGLYNNIELISSISFKKSKDNTIELVRFCSKLNTSVVGGFSKLLKHSIKYIKQNYPNINKIVTFGYRDWCPDYRDSVYYKNGFTFIKYCNPSLSYYNDKNKIVYNRQKFMKYKLQKLFPETYNENLTEKEILEKNGIYTIYDSGTIRFELDI